LGALRVGDPMNAALVDDLETFRVRATWLDGALVARDGESLLPTLACAPANRFEAERITAAQLRIPVESQPVRARVIVVEDGQLVTREAFAELSAVDGFIEPSLATDTLLLAVVNRYRVAPPAVALVRGFRLARGALAASVAHDSHNVIAVGCDAPSLAAAINAVIDARGGLSVAYGPGEAQALALPIAGLMSDRDGDYVAARYAALDDAARSALGSTLRAPFMTLSFMALLVIPELKLSDLGLFDGRTFAFTNVAVA
jgi:adenine deaminase